jgi:hypothetical protein
MRSLTTEEIAKLKAKAKALKAEIAAYSKHTFEDILIEDISVINF